jgi:hypothetical protein
LLDLPLNNFKNRQGTSNTAKSAAIRKQVLANIPAAFATGLEINSMSFHIVDMLSEQTATEIKRSVINFTIE